MQKICPNCQQVNPPEAMFCRQCASTLGAAQPNAPQYANPPQPQNPQWNQPKVGNQGMQQNFPQAGAAKSNRGIIGLVLVIVGLLCCGPFTSLPGAIMGWLELSAIKEGKAPADGLMIAQIALWGGIAVAVLHLVLYFLWVLLQLVVR